MCCRNANSGAEIAICHDLGEGGEGVCAKLQLITDQGVQILL